MRRVLSVWCPYWPTERLAGRSESERPEPVVTAETVRGVRLVASACPRAQAQGVQAAQKLADARAVCPNLVAHEADPAGDAAALARLAVWCERYTPLSAMDAPDGVWLDITGCAHLWGGEKRLLDDLVTRLAQVGHRSQAAVAGTPGAAWALARVPGAPQSAGLEAEVLADLPVAALRLDPCLVADLRRVGLRTVGEMARLPRGELSTRFGPMPVLRLDQAMGRVAETIAWPRPLAPWEERLAFAEPILTPEDLQRVLAALAESLCAQLRAQEHGGRRFTAEFFRVDGQRPALVVSTALPTREPSYLYKLLAAKLDTLDPGFGVEVVRLSADWVASLPPAQPGLANNREGGRLPAVLDQLVNRSSPGRVWRTAPYGSHVPERAAVQVLPMTSPTWTDGMLERPLRLMSRPEPIEAIALTPDHPPIRFVWRGVARHIRAAAGPERIAREWWRARLPDDSDDRPETDRVRDYYRVEDSEGARFWVYRAGLSPGRWFLHGIFA